MSKVLPLKDQMPDMNSKLQKQLGDVNFHQVPQVEKIVVNVGTGSLVQANKKDLDYVVANITAITGQKPVVINSRKAISNFKLRIGMPIGVKVTLRGERMYNFLNKLINVIFPRIRDFQGFTKRSFDSKGNISIGIKDQTVFPEISPDDLNRTHGIQFTIHTSATEDESAYELLKTMGFPFKEAKAKPQN